jgi:hypothetical protein
VNEDDRSAAIAGSRADRALQLAQLELSPSAADKARGRAALELPQPPPLPVATYPSAWAALGASGKVGVLVSAVLLGVGFGAGYWLGRAEPRVAAPSDEQPPALASSAPSGSTSGGATDGMGRPMQPLPRAEAELDAGRPAPSDDDRRAKVSSATGVGAPLGPLPRSARPAPKAPGPQQMADAPREEGTRASRNSEELDLMRRIERSLRNDQPALALALLAEVEARFPRSALEEERLAASVMAHCGLQDPGHERRAESFLQSRPRSVYRTRVMAACGTPGVSAPPDGSENRPTASDGKARRGDQ